MKKKINIASILICAATLVCSTVAFGVNLAEQTLTIQATVTNACSVSTTAEASTVNLGSITPSATVADASNTSTGVIHAQCTNGYAYAMAVGTSTTGNLTSGTESLPFTFGIEGLVNSTLTGLLGQGFGADNTSVTQTIHFKIPAAGIKTAKAGLYQNVVVVSLY